MSTPQETVFPVVWGGDVTDGPDGRKWVQVMLNGPFTSIATSCPPEMARHLASELPNMLNQLADLCENSSKLVVPANNGKILRLKDV